MRNLPYRGSLNAKRSRELLVALCVLAFAAGLRLWLFPTEATPERTDEIEYLSAGLQLLEGDQGYKAAPAAFISWLVAAIAAARSGVRLLTPSPEIAALPLAMRPAAAIDGTLFEIYADLNPLHILVAWVTFLVSMLAVLAAVGLGNRRAGWGGALLAGGLMAVTPIFAQMSVQTRSYSFAWSFGLLALAAAATLEGRWRARLAGVFFGLAAACRIELALLAPLVVWEFYHHKENSPSWRAAVRTLGIAFVAFALAAPWYITNLVVNVGQALSIASHSGGTGSSLDFLSGSGQAWAPVYALILVGLLSRLRTAPWQTATLLAYLALLFCFGLNASGNGLRYHGALLVAVVSCAPLALNGVVRSIPERYHTHVASAACFVLLLGPFTRTLSAGMSDRAYWVENDAVAWVEENVPAGATVYIDRRFSWPLPTVASSRALWGEINEPDAWQLKFREVVSRTHAGEIADLPRALSHSYLHFARAIRRRVYILGGPHVPKRPRYDLVLVDPNSIYDLDFDQAIDAYIRDGGAMLYYGQPLPRLGRPTVSWAAPDDRGTHVYWKGPGRH